MQTGQHHKYIDRSIKMNTFQSSELFGAFLIFVVVFILLVLLDLCYQHWNSRVVENPINERNCTFRFKVKKVIARILLKLGKRKAICDDRVDRIQVFSDDDPMVRAAQTIWKNDCIYEVIHIKFLCNSQSMLYFLTQVHQASKL